MAETTTIARPYARAAFEQAQETGNLQACSDLLQLAALIITDKDMHQLLLHPKLGTREKAKLLLDMCSEIYRNDIPETVRNFIGLLAENRRLTAIPEIALIFEKLRAEAEKTIQAQLISAFAVTEEQRHKIAEGLKKRLKRDIVLESSVDESLLGGVIIRAGDLVIDGSARGYLNKLAAALSQ